MFIGHYGPAVWDAHRAQGVRLWHGFVAVQAIDLVFCVLAILGLEGGTLPNAHPLAFNIPYSHSLVGAVVISFAVAGLYRGLRPNAGGKGAVVMGLLAFSHWPLDWVVHRPDLPIFPNGETMLGLGLWDYPWPTYAVEVLLLAGMMAWWLRVTAGPRWTSVSAWAVVAVMAGLQFMVITAPTLALQAGMFDPSALPAPTVIAVQGLVVYAVTFAVIALIERARTTRP